MTEAARACWQAERGAGPTVVLVHGAMDRAGSFRRVQRLLEGFRSVAYDRRGYAHSLELGPPTAFDDQVSDLLGVIGDEPALVFGHSYGGCIALAAAQRAPRVVRGVVAYEFPMPWTPWWPRRSVGAAALDDHASSPEDAAESFMRRMVGDQRWERLPSSTRDERRAEGPTFVAELAQIRAPHPAAFDPEHIEVPIVAAHGTEGAPHHRRSVETVAAAAPLGELATVEGAGHGIHLTHPSAAVRLIERAQESATRLGR